jgi:drug/metabolite transporter (DMT)-like permease
MLNEAILFALFSLAFAGLNEIVFKRYSAQERSRGMMISGVGVVWSLLLYADVTMRGDNIVFSTDTILYGLTAGIVVAAANILLLESLRHMEVSLGSTIYRLNTIVVVILSVILLGETITFVKLAGVACGVMAVLLLYRHHHSTGQTYSLKLGLTMVIIAALLRAAYGVITKAGLSQGADADALMLISALSWVVSGLLYAVFIEHRYAITRKKISYALLSGCLVYGIVKSLVTALSYGEASVVITVANLSFLMALLVALVLKMEKLSLRKVAAMSFAVGAIALLTQA